MAANTSPIFVATPKIGHALISTANTNRDGTGTIGTVYTPGADGGLIEKIVIQAIGTTTAGMVRLYIHDGATARLWREVPVSAITPSATVPAFRALLEPDLDRELPLPLPSTHSLRASTEKAESFGVFAQTGDYS